MKKFIFLFIPFLIFAQENHFNHTNLNWKTIETEHFKINFHIGAERSAKVVAKVAEEIFEPITNFYNHKPSQKVSFVIKDVDDYSNGAAYFYDNKIEIWAPSLDFEFRGTHNWLRNVVTHEFTHIIQMQTTFKFGRTFPSIYLQALTYETEQRPDVLYGFPNSISSIPVSGFIVPSWFAEGVAQYNHPNLFYDTWDSHRDMILRSYILDENLLSWNEISTFGKNSLGNESSYNIGFAFSNYLISEFGFDVLKKVSFNLSAPTVLTMDDAIYNSTGFSGKEVYEKFKKKLSTIYNESVKNVRANLVEGENIFSNGFGNFYPTKIPGKNKIAFISTLEKDYLGQTSIVFYDFETKKDSALKINATSQLAFSEDGNKIYYSNTSYENPNGANVFDIYEYDLSKKEENRITFNARANQPTIFANQIAYVVSNDGTCNLEIFDLIHKTKNRITNFSNGEQIYTPKFSPNGKKIVCSFSVSESQNIILINLASGEIEIIVENQFDNRNPIFSENTNELYFASDLSGIYNIYKLDLETRLKPAQLTNVLGGAFMPIKISDKIFYSCFTSGGYKIFEIENKNIETENNYSKPDFRKNFKLFSQDSNFTKLNLFDDKNLLNYNINEYRNIFTSMSFVPVVRFDNYNKKFKSIDQVKLGTYFFSGDVVGKYNIFGAATINKQFERDIYASFEFRDKLPIFNSFDISPTLRFEVFNVTRKSNAEIILPSDSISTDVGYGLFEFDASLNYHIFSPADEIILKYRMSNYSIDIGSFIIKESSLLVPASTEKYFNGKAIDLIFNFDGIKRSILSSINPSGRKTNFTYSYEMNELNSDGEYEVTENGVFPKFANYIFHKIQIKHSEYLKISDNQTLNFTFNAGTNITKQKLPDFFDFYLGGLIGMRGYNFYSVSGNEFASVISSYRFPILKKINYQIGPIIFEKLFCSISSGIGNAWNSKPKITDFKKDAGIELRLQGTSFYSYPLKIFASGNYGFDEVKTISRFGTDVIYKPEWKFYFGILFDFEIE